VKPTHTNTPIMMEEEQINNDGKDTKDIEMEEISAVSNSNGVSLFDDDDQIQDDKIEIETESESSKEDDEKYTCYPADCYSFLALYGPIHNPG
jgi:hypothetical protein